MMRPEQGLGEAASLILLDFLKSSVSPFVPNSKLHFVIQRRNVAFCFSGQLDIETDRIVMSQCLGE